jgi:2-polyprenyl-3-methyl-5-hydroxy-6-metoxy-1,4-benzoquinol methylase
MSHAAYDAIVDDYAAFVGTHLAEATSVLGVATRGLLDLAGPVAGLAVCDLGCGEGHLARYLAGQGSQVVGVDISAALLQLARRAPARMYASCRTTRNSCGPCPTAPLI